MRLATIGGDTIDGGVTARFQVLFVFVAMEIGSRRIVHCHVTAHPTAEWTLQQFREAIPSDHPYRFLIHERDSIFSSELDQELKLTFGLRELLMGGAMVSRMVLSSALSDLDGVFGTDSLTSDGILTNHTPPIR